MNTEDLEYVGCWLRVGASCNGTLVRLAITAPITYAIQGRYTSPAAHFMGPADLKINLILSAIAVIMLWMRFGARPGNKRVIPKECR